MLLFILVLVFVSCNAQDFFSPSEVIELPVGRFPEPDCSYSVRHKSANGPLVKGRVDIGDEIYHGWECNYKSRHNYLFCILVNNCTVSDNSGDGERQVKIIDDNGCSLYPTILPNVHYTGDLTAGINVHAFSLDVDTTAIHFTCNIRMVFKDHGRCQRPSCARIM